MTLVSFPLFPSEMQEVLTITMTDLELCMDDDLLDWDIAHFVRIKQLLDSCKSSVSGRWLCEWAEIPTLGDAGPCRFAATGVQQLIAFRRAHVRSPVFHVTVGTIPKEVERTLGLEGSQMMSALSWHDVRGDVTEPASTILIAYLELPGEAVAGGSKSTSALDGTEVRGAFVFSRAVLQFELPLRELWRLFLQGSRIVLFVGGSEACCLLCQKLELCLALNWSLRVLSSRLACFLSDGQELSALFPFHPCN